MPTEFAARERDLASAPSHVGNRLPGGVCSEKLAPMTVPEAPLRSTRFGLVPDGEGWLVINATETRWRDYGPLGVACDFEGKWPFK
jgi:hypothetical protein